MNRSRCWPTFEGPTHFSQFAPLLAQLWGQAWFKRGCLIRMIDGPLFVGEDYLPRREIVALSQSKRTESFWVRTRIFDASGKNLKAEMPLNHASLKASFAGYGQSATGA